MRKKTQFYGFFGWNQVGPPWNLFMLNWHCGSLSKVTLSISLSSHFVEESPYRYVAVIFLFALYVRSTLRQYTRLRARVFGPQLPSVSLNLILIGFKSAEFIIGIHQHGISSIDEVAYLLCYSGSRCRADDATSCRRLLTVKAIIWIRPGDPISVSACSSHGLEKKVR